MPDSEETEATPISCMTMFQRQSAGPRSLFFHTAPPPCPLNPLHLSTFLFLLSFGTLARSCPWRACPLATRLPAKWTTLLAQTHPPLPPQKLEARLGRGRPGKDHMPQSPRSVGSWGWFLPIEFLKRCAVSTFTGGGLCRSLRNLLLLPAGWNVNLTGNRVGLNGRARVLWVGGGAVGGWVSAGELWRDRPPGP